VVDPVKNNILTTSLITMQNLVADPLQTRSSPTRVTLPILVAHIRMGVDRESQKFGNAGAPPLGIGRG